MDKTRKKISARTLPYQRIVVKVGTTLLTDSSGRLYQEMMSNLVAQIAQLHKQGRQILLVSSGAMASGRDRLGLTGKPKGIPFKQVLASIGQVRLMNIYEQILR